MDLRLAFLSEMNVYEFHSEILGHELRHQIDGSNSHGLPLGRKKMEYNATIASIAYSINPHYAVATYLKTPDGKKQNFLDYYSAPLIKILPLFHDWIKDHHEEILNYDDNRPELAQIDKITSEQVRAAFRTMFK